ncbi:putative carboxylesterase family protein [Lyophyllum shimeji]|uniref:Carboxylesterase family protein n=1 Tax=Lyophyllum shimeji TaxID=47721 RepID=A0A9P3UR45_LYOSH|nr:putative carboxylesterase family protein [Lyophyllum shimeji]
METIAKFTSNEIPGIRRPTFDAFLPFLEEKRAQIQGIPRKAFKYGPTDRHHLDVYYPIGAPHASGKTPILFWVYGGGFTTGARRMAAPMDLGYACVGAFFARRGFLVIIPDYRLFPDAVFPGAVEDVRAAILWTIDNPAHLTTPSSPHPDTEQIFVMGHSAGATHVISALLLPSTPHEWRARIAGAILCAGAHHFDALDPEHETQAVVEQLYGGKKGVKENEPMGLLRRADDATVAALPRMVLVVAENEPQWLHKASDDFAVALEARTGEKPSKIVARGHNHISVNWALSTGQGETWAEDVIAWINA